MIINDQIKHVFIIVLENEGYDNVIGNSSAPYLNSLANRYTLATNYYAIAHPSEPNYIAMISGSTLNVTNDGNVHNNQRAATNIVDLFRAKNMSWSVYEESMPFVCDTNDSPSGLYVTKHNPFVYMTDITSNKSYCNLHVLNFTQLYTDLASNHTPQYAFIVPNMNDDGHNTDLATADVWLSAFLPGIINSSSFQSSVIFITFDEGSAYSPGSSRVPMIVVGPSSIVKQGFRTSSLYSHYSLLATVESIYKLGNLGRWDTNASAMNDVFVVH